MQNHASLTPLVNDILSKQMITKVAAPGFTYHSFFLSVHERLCEWNKKNFFFVNEV
jgi:hypothetical protein